MSKIAASLLLALALAACRQAETQNIEEEPTANDIAAFEAQANADQAIEPGEPGDLPGDSNLVEEAPIDPKSAQGAARLLQRYGALLEQKRFSEAWRLWSDRGRASGLSEAEFAGEFAKHAQIHVEIGAPDRIEGAAGSSYVEFPLRLDGRLTSGREFTSVGTATLRRVNDVPGSTAEQRQWRIHRIVLQPPL